MLATASYDNTINLWSVKDGQLLRSFNGHEDGVLAVSFDPTGQLIVTASNDNTIRIWDLEGTLITTLSGHTQGVHDVAIETEAEYVVSASADSTILIWERQDMDDIDALLQSSCNWLSDYLTYNDSVDLDTEALCFTHEEENGG